MQEINLLQNKIKDKSNQWENHNRLAIVLLSLIVVAELVGSGIFYTLKSKAEKAQAELTLQNASIQKDLDSKSGQLTQAKGFQAQSKNISVLLDSHVAWSELMNELATKTLKQARFLSLTSETSGVIHIEGLTPNYVNLGKLILALEQSEHIERVNLDSTAPSNSDFAGVIFSLEVVVERDIFLYQ
jgi:Tfp pilus assembly protein PilN